MERHTSASQSHHRPLGFTVVELLVSIGIVVLLASILLVAVSRGYGTARKVRAQADLQVIALALEAYKQDFGDYPRAILNPALGSDATHPNPPTADQLLCFALAGPLPAVDPAPVLNRVLMQDGANGPGFRIRGIQGKIYGPYIDLDKFDVDSANWVIRSRVFSTNDGTPTPPILYIPKNVRSIQPQQNYVAPDPGAMYDISSIPASINWPNLGTRAPLSQIQGMMGNKNQTNPNPGVYPITGNDVPAFTGPYILWMAGADNMFGLSNSRGARNVDDGAYTTDDITNFNFDPAITVK